MKSQDQLLDAKAAADIVGVCYTAINWYHTKGIIQGYNKPGVRTRLFKMKDILALKARVERNAKKDRGRTRGSQIKRTVRELEVTVSQLNKEMELMKSYIGMDFEPLPTDEEGVSKLYQEAVGLGETHILKLDDIQRWLLVFSVMSEKFLLLVHEQFHDPEPWKPFVRAAEIVDKAIGSDVDLLKHSEYARRNFRNAIYSAAFVLYGAKAANSMFDSVPYCDRLIKSMFMVWEFSRRKERVPADRVEI